VCEESQACKDLAFNCAGNCGFNGGDCRCSGAPKNVEIVDVLKIPADLKPGKYVLGWRCVAARLAPSPSPPPPLRSFPPVPSNYTLSPPLPHRWDCEETDQIWSSCSDVLVTAAATTLV
jgi:hypothetical protein